MIKVQKYKIRPMVLPFYREEKQEEIECVYRFKIRKHEFPTTSTNYSKLEKITHLPFFYELGLNNYFASDSILPSQY